MYYGSSGNQRINRNYWLTGENFKFPKEVKVIGRYLLIGRHISVTIFEAPSEESILKITYSFGELGIAHVAPALPLEDALKMMEKM